MRVNVVKILLLAVNAEQFGLGYLMARWNLALLSLSCTSLVLPCLRVVIFAQSVLVPTFLLPVHAVACKF